MWCKYNNYLLVTTFLIKELFYYILSALKCLKLETYQGKK